MSQLLIPVTASAMPEWVRRAATAVNSVLGRTTALETETTNLDGRVTTLENGGGSTGAIAYVYSQGAASALWNVNHNLGFYPNTNVQDSTGTPVQANVKQIDQNNLTIGFAHATGGTAFLS